MGSRFQQQIKQKMAFKQQLKRDQLLLMRIWDRLYFGGSNLIQIEQLISAHELNVYLSLYWLKQYCPLIIQIIQIYCYNLITNMYSLVKTLKRKGDESLKKVRSCDDLNRTSQLSLNEVKILLCCDHSESHQDLLSHRVKKQQILQRNRLFDPLKLFGMSTSQSVQQSARNNSARLNSMFDSINGSKNNSCSKKTQKKETLMMGKPLNTYLKQNKQNYQKNGANNYQKMRIKLKLNKKMP